MREPGAVGELHARLAREAKELKVSLNQLINQRLSAR
ncbi:toxin-antitoxin system HicB family antitoxin [Nocardia neocaledoniensis]